MELIPVFHGIIFHGILEFLLHLVEYSNIPSDTHRNGMEQTSNIYISIESRYVVQ